ncbi:SDR family oxidoreductase [Arcticibacterium luteifluviistationis]|uniref:NAD-dependent dehydratase n=1 Tax=Arcticibacterium luteifluviistationis TaxID=1784714 RepID=A0A2Z4GBT4_9BACT|nr:SDR family oxidoreductase [Arcticibacterium luteifluviistationis]AWV98515.1 NAD-dependent dehydratase [Arcticibacterium luteifluviistationis]
MNELKNVLVAGANGSTGRTIVNLLKKSETYKPIAMVRKQDQKDHFENQGVTTVLADLEEDLSNTVKNVDKVIFAAGSNGKNVIAVDQEGAKSLTDAAKQAGVQKFVMLSSMGADHPDETSNLEDYLIAKQNADTHLLTSGLNYSIVRPGQLTNSDGTGKIQLNEKLKIQGSISREDVAKTLVEALDSDVRQNQVFEIISGKVPIEIAVRS